MGVSLKFKGFTILMLMLLVGISDGGEEARFAQPGSLCKGPGHVSLAARSGEVLNVYKLGYFMRADCGNYPRLDHLLRMRGGADFCPYEYAIDNRFADTSLLDDITKDPTQEDPDTEIWNTRKWKEKIRQRKKLRDSIKFSEQTDFGTMDFVASKEWVKYWMRNQRKVPKEVCFPSSLSSRIGFQNRSIFIHYIGDGCVYNLV